MSEVKWQGGCELRDEEGVRIGNLYVTGTDIFFIEAGRGGLTQYRQALAVLLFAGALALVPLSAEIYAWTYRGGARMSLVAALEVAAAVAAVGMLGLAALTARAAKRAYEEGLLRLGDSEAGTPEPEMLAAAVDAVSGSLRLPVPQAERMERQGPRLRLDTELGETWDLLILPSPDGFVAAVRGT
jgi:hypothetical protein